MLIQCPRRHITSLESSYTHTQINSKTELHTYFSHLYAIHKVWRNWNELHRNDERQIYAHTVKQIYTRISHSFNWHYTITSIPLKYVNGMKTSLCVYDNKKKSNKDSELRREEKKIKMNDNWTLFVRFWIISLESKENRDAQMANPQKQNRIEIDMKWAHKIK